MPPIHQRVDIGKWVREFPLNGERAAVRARVEEWARENPARYKNEAAKMEHAQMMMPDGEIIVGPQNLARNEQLRAEAGPPSSYGPGVATDVMVWADGEPTHPAGTKFGGRPYRPAGSEWPVGQDGAPSTFLGQICFADSRDVLLDRGSAPLKLPGDVLLLFLPNPDGVWDSDDEDPKCLQHEWQPLGITNLVQPGDIPKQPIDIAPCYAELHRTHDYPEVPEQHPIRRFGMGYRVCVIEGGKIGGAPAFVQNDDPRPGVFLGALGSINPVGPRYPLLNTPVNPKGEYNLGGGHMMFGDCGSLYLFLDHVGLIRRTPQLRWTVQGY